MTDEQIKQNAEEYYDKLDLITIEVENEPNSIVEAYVAGAHNRNEEIEMWKRVVEERQLEIEKLRNPLISVTDQLPEKSKKYKGWLSDTVFVITNKNDGTSARYDHETKTWCPAKILQGSIAHWMPIPELKKGE